jgi:pimeloyl-ACP methyl ester carboxylesterase
MIGEAPTLVGVGGTLCDSRLFEPLQNHLGRVVRVWNSTDQRSVGDAALAILDDIAGPLVIVGFSLGGFVALEALRRAPHRVRAVILVSGNAFPDDPAIAVRRRLEVSIGRTEGLASLIFSRSDSLVASECPDRADVIALIASMAEACGHEVHACHAEMNITRPDLRDVISRAARPILAMAGTADLLCPIERYRDLQASPGVVFEMVEGAGHFLPLEAPSQCAMRIDRFLKGIDR